jgi:hypothetical protein
MQCSKCQGTIDPVRLEILPDTTLCVDCSRLQPGILVCRMLYSHKTGGELVVARDPEAARLLDREYKRSR